MQARKADSRAEEPTAFTTPSISLPKGGGNIRGIGEKFAVNPVRGTGTFTIPLSISPGRSGFMPQLSLAYDSGAGNGPFGFGWSLSAQSITRKTDKGLPRYRDGDESDIYILSGAEDLVPGLHEPDRVPGFDIHRYRPRIEGPFARIERWTERASGITHWRSISRDNVTTLYGLTAESRISDPDDETRTFSWLVCQSHDDKGNAIVYGYANENDAEVKRSQTNERNRLRGANRYLKSVRYGNTSSRLLQPDLTQLQWLFELVFDYDEDHCSDLPPDDAIPRDEQHSFVRATVAPQRAWRVRPDPFSSYRSGFEVRTYRRCRRVLMFHRFPEPRLVRSLELDYADLPDMTAAAICEELAHPGSTRFASSIRAVTQCGFVPVEGEPDKYLKKALPPIELEYSKAVIDEDIHEIEARELEDLPIGIDGARYQWVDLDGEGVSGILTEQAGSWRYKPSLGGGRFGPQQTVSVNPSLATAGRSHQLLDLGGDGQLDVVTLDGPIPGFYERTTDERWEPFRAFAQRPHIDFYAPNLRFVDLNGDGHADVLITEDEVFSWHESLAEEGYGPARKVRQPADEERGPRLVFADGTQSIHLADMCGDGLTALVRIRNGEICYWPNLGYGRFGAKVTMDNAPRLDLDDQFDQRRVRLADVDGSGVSDLVYLGRDRVRIYFNQSGNRWSEARPLDCVPTVDDLVSVMTADLLGNGTACLVWSSARPGDAGRPLRYIDLMGGRKPHLLVKAVNNLGAETHVEYAPSTKFYLADKKAGQPWITRIPFPVHVVERIVTLDVVSGNRFVTRYEYHHGYFDGEERELRGFALVEQRDTEEFAELTADGRLPPATNVERTSHVPAVRTRTWFHTGTFTARRELSRLVGNSIESVVPAGLSAAEEREACRALKGSMLRQEVVGLDRSDRPYSIVEQSFSVTCLRRRGPNRHAVFLTSPRESIRSHHERDPGEPRVEHALTLEVDRFGNVLRSAAIAYGRTAPDAELSPQERAAQSTTWITCAENEFTHDIDTDADYRAPLPSRSRSYELTGLAPAAGQRRFTFAQVDDAVRDAQAQKRRIEDVRTLYRRNDLTGPLPHGGLESLALPHEIYKLAFTADVLAPFGGRVTNAMLEEGGYVHFDGDADWWMPSGRMFHSPGSADSAAAELAQARQHFFLPRCYHDPFQANTIVDYDVHDLLVTETRDAAGNRTAAEHDYRVLQPSLVTDANGNRVAAAFDALGMVAATAVMGKTTAASGDTLAGIVPDLTEKQIRDDVTAPLARPHDFLQQATTRIVYALAPQPVVVHVLSRETHVGELAGGQTRIRHSLAYSDGFGRELQTKVQGEAGQWVGSGWTIFDNKGNPVRRYEPFFTTKHRFEANVLNGVATTLFYEPAGRVVSALHPDHSWEKVELHPWRSETWDANDTIGIDDPASDAIAGAFFRRLPDDDYLPTWKQQRSTASAEEQAAAAKTAVHANTPVTTHFDALGRAFLAVARNRFRYSDAAADGEETFRTRTAFDAEGNVREVVDALGRVVVRYDYDLLGHRVHTKSIDAGERWQLDDVAGKPLYAWDSLEQRTHTHYDALRRPVALLLSEGANAEIVVGRTVYGDAQPPPRPDPATANLLGQIVESDDQAGVVANEAYDFKGNLLRVTRQLARDSGTLDWSAHVPLDGAVYETSTRYDALNRVIATTTPDNSVVRNFYNEAGFLDRVEANLRGAMAVTTFITNIDYDEKGQRTLVRYGNGVTTRYSYDRFTFRLRELVTRRGQDDVQLLHYTYDPIGNVTHIRDDAQQTIFFRNRRVEPSAEYTYDATYRLIEATGRELLGLIDPKPIPPDAFNTFHTRPLDPRDGNALGTYREQYVYDAVGNLRTMRHRGTDPAHPGWTRDYDYGDDSTNRLSETILNGTVSLTERYVHDASGHVTRLPHLAIHADPNDPNVHWDHRDQLARADLPAGAVVRYAYDAAGRRVRTIWKKEAALFDERVYLGTFETFRRHDGAGTDASRRETLHIMDGKQRIALVETSLDVAQPQPVVLYQLANHLGSVSLDLDDAGELLSYEEYTPYGSTSYQDGGTSKRYRFTGKQRDEETGLYYHGARYYAPWVGRWVSCDPAGVDADPAAYSFARNNPINLKDPDGREPKPVKDEEHGDVSEVGIAAGSAHAVVEGAIWNPTVAGELSKNTRGMIDRARGVKLEKLAGNLRIFGGLGRYAEDADRVTKQTADQIRSVYGTAKRVGQVARDATFDAARYIAKHAEHAAKAARARIILPTGAGQKVVEAAEKAMSTARRVLPKGVTAAVPKVTTGLPGVLGAAAKVAAPVGAVLSAASLSSNIEKGDFGAAFADAAGFTAGALETGALVLSATGAGGGGTALIATGGVAGAGLSTAAAVAAPLAIGAAIGVGLEKSLNVSDYASDAGVAVYEKARDLGLGETSSFVIGGVASIAAIPSAIGYAAAEKLFEPIDFEAMTRRMTGGSP